MPNTISADLMADELYLAGERVAAGLYREITTGREIRLETEDYLPATNNGRVAAYILVRHTWGQRQKAQ